MLSIHLISNGEFGTELTQHIGNNSPFVTTASHLKTINNDNLFDKLPKANIYTIATSNYTSYIYKTIDYQTYHKGGYWIPIAYDHPYLRVGPIFNPRGGTCYRCFEHQLLANKPFSNYLNETYNFYNLHPTSGPKGYLPSFLGWTKAMYFYVLHQFIEIEGYELGTFYQKDVTNQHIIKDIYYQNGPCNHYI